LLSNTADPSDANDNLKKKKKKKPTEKNVETDTTTNDAVWGLACDTEADWRALVDRLAKSKKKVDKELYSIVDENFLPEVNKMFVERERKEKIQLMMMNKRTSSRIDLKRKRQEEMEAKESLRRQEAHRIRMEQEASRAQKEKENKIKSRESRAQRREETLNQQVRQRQREQRAERRLSRPEQAGEPQELPSYDDEQVQVDDIEQCRREVERDHDYLAWSLAGQVANSIATTSCRRAMSTNTTSIRGSGNTESRRRSKPAIKEWIRLLQEEESQQLARSSIRF